MQAAQPDVQDAVHRAAAGEARPGALCDATINYLSQPDRLTIEWRNVRVAKPYEHPNGGNFTFQGRDRIQ